MPNASDQKSVIKSPAEVSKPFEYVVCANKAIDQDTVAASLRAAVDETKTTIVIIQNGVGNEEPFRKAFPKTTIISCVVYTLPSYGVGPAKYTFRHGQERHRPARE